MIDVTSEQMIPFQKASSHVPGRPHISTLHRWRSRGARGARLESLLIGGRRYTSVEAIQRFLAAGTDEPEDDQKEKYPLSPRDHKEHDVERQLDEIGLGD